MASAASGPASEAGKARFRWSFVLGEGMKAVDPSPLLIVGLAILLVASPPFRLPALAQQVTPVTPALVDGADPTVVALEKLKLAEEVAQLQRADDLNLQDWFGANVNGLVSSLGAVAVGAFALRLYVNGKKVAQTLVSTGTGARDLGDELLSRMARQLRVSMGYFKGIIECEHTNEDYLNLLRDQGSI